MARFFRSRFLGMIVDFPETSPWKLLTKIEEEAVQNFEDEEATSFSCALFSCETPSNDSNPSRKALMRIWMRIPFEGSESEPPATRAVQASQELPLDAEYELKALQRLLAIGSLHTPKLLASKHETQPNDGMVPGGFIFFLKCPALPSQGRTNLARSPFIGLNLLQLALSFDRPSKRRGSMFETNYYQRFY
jgi:hypothetical protein